MFGGSSPREGGAERGGGRRCHSPVRDRRGETALAQIGLEVGRWLVLVGWSPVEVVGGVVRLLRLLVWCGAALAVGGGVVNPCGVVVRSCRCLVVASVVWLSRCVGGLRWGSVACRRAVVVCSLVLLWVVGRLIEVGRLLGLLLGLCGAVAVLLAAFAVAAAFLGAWLCLARSLLRSLPGCLVGGRCARACAV